MEVGAHAPLRWGARRAGGRATAEMDVRGFQRGSLTSENTLPGNSVNNVISVPGCAYDGPPRDLRGIAEPQL